MNGTTPRGSRREESAPARQSMKKAATPRIETHLPLRPVVYAVLVVLDRGRLHGHAIMEQVNACVSGTRILGPGTLYRVLKEMREAGLVAAVDPPDDEGDERRSYHGTTELGRQVVRAESRRLARLMGRDLLEEVAAEGELAPEVGRGGDGR